MAENWPPAGAPERVGRVQEPRGRVRAAVAEVARTAADPSARERVRAVGLPAGAVESVAAPPPGGV